MNSKLLFALIISCISFNASSKLVTVEATGNGSTLDYAINTALKDAIKQINGVSLDSQLIQNISSTSEQIANSGTTQNYDSMKKSTLQNLQESVRGFVSSYEIISKEQTETGWEVSLKAKIEKYIPPGTGDNRRSISISNFEANPGKCFGKTISPKEIGELLTSELTTAFTKTRKFAVLDRNHKQAFDAEKQMIASADSDKKELAKLGLARGSDYIVTGKIRKLDLNKNTRSIKLTGDTLTTLSGSAEVQIDLLSFATRQVKFSSVITVRLDDSQLRGVGCNDAISKLLREASKRGVEKAMLSIYPPTVVSVSNNGIYINYGGDDIKIGSKYALYRLGEKIRDPYTGESLGSQEIKVGTIQITDTKPKYSIGTLIAGKFDDVKIGFICRPIPSQSSQTKVSPKPKKSTTIKEDEW